MSKSTIPMPVGYQDTTWPVDDETLERIRKAFASWQGKSHTLSAVPRDAPEPSQRR